jgi:hypothetical protein
LDVATSDEPHSEYKTVLNKSLDISEISLQAGERSLLLKEEGTDSNPCPSTVALAQGAGHVYIRVVEYNNNNNNNKSTTTSAKDNNRHLQQDVEVKLNHQVNVSVDPTSICQIQQFLEAFCHGSEWEEEPTTTLAAASDVNVPSDISKTSFAITEDSDQDDLKAISGIMSSCLKMPRPRRANKKWNKNDKIDTTLASLPCRTIKMPGKKIDSSAVEPPCAP